MLSKDCKQFTKIYVVPEINESGPIRIRIVDLLQNKYLAYFKFEPKTFFFFQT